MVEDRHGMEFLGGVPLRFHRLYKLFRFVVIVGLAGGICAPLAARTDASK